MLVALGALALGPAAAPAATLTKTAVGSDDVYRLVDAGSADHTIQVELEDSAAGHKLVYDDLAAAITIDPSAAAFCTAEAPGGDDQVRCDHVVPEALHFTLGDGKDTLDVDTAVEGDLPVPGSLKVDGGAGNDDLEGSEQGDEIDGGDGADIIRAWGADDLIFGGAGADVINGGTGGGNDRISYADGRQNGVTVLLGTDSGVRDDGGPEDGPPGVRDALNNIESVTGTGFADSLSGQPVINTLDGGGGDDLLIGLGGADTLNGGEGDDTLDGGALNDVLRGDGGFDTVDYGSRAAPLTISLDGVANDGETGEADAVDPSVERVLGGNAGDRITAGAAGAVLVGGAGDDALFGGGGDDVLEGGAGADGMDGGQGTDLATYAAVAESVTVTLNDGAGDDGGAADANGVVRDTITTVERVAGGAGDDRLVGDSGTNLLDGGAGADVLVGREGFDVLIGGSGADAASYEDRGTSNPVTVVLDGTANDGGGAENDDIRADVEGAIGGAGADTLIGNHEVNRLVGGDGNDGVTGHGGSDTLFGGAGDDAIEARDGAAEDVDCGSGTDAANVDGDDRLTGCEIVTPEVVVHSQTQPPPPDRDGDGFHQGIDCDDGNPAIRPGAREVLGNAVDENCDGERGAYPVLDIQLITQYRVGRTVKVVLFLVRRLPAGSKVVVACRPPPRGRRRGRGSCPFARRSFQIRRAGGQVSLTRTFAGRRLRAGTRLEITITAPETIGKVVRQEVRRRRGRTRIDTTTVCVLPEGRKRVRCPSG